MHIVHNEFYRCTITSNQLVDRFAVIIWTKNVTSITNRTAKLVWHPNFIHKSRRNRLVSSKLNQTGPKSANWDAFPRQSYSSSAIYQTVRDRVIAVKLNDLNDCSKPPKRSNSQPSKRSNSQPSKRSNS